MGFLGRLLGRGEEEEAESGEVEVSSVRADYDSLSVSSVVDEVEVDEVDEGVDEVVSDYGSGGGEMDGLDVTCKVMLLGDGGVGKTTLFHRYLTNKFSQDTKMTIGVDIQSKVVRGVESEGGDEYDVSIQLWDLGGQERFESVRTGFYGGTNGALLLYDVTRFESYSHLGDWLGEMYEHSKVDEDEVSVIVIGNKVDLLESEEWSRCVSYDVARDWAESRGFSYLETSAKTGSNVEEAFRYLCEKMLVNTLSKGSDN